MGLLDNIKAKADANGDGKVSAADLEALKDGLNNEQLDKIKEKFLGKDGKLSLEDLKSLNLDSLKSSAGDIVNNAKDTLGGVFGKKL